MTCTNSQDVSGLNVTLEAKMSFKSNKISDLTLTMVVTGTSDLMKESWSAIEKAYDEKYAPVEKDGLKVSNKLDPSNYKYTIMVSADPSKVSASDLSPYGMSSLAGAKDSYKTVKSGLENAGFTCK